MEKCLEKVADHTGFHFYPCNRPAKFVGTREPSETLYLCGIHARMYKGREYGHWAGWTIEKTL